MRNSIFFLFIVFVLSLTSCRKDFDFERSSGNLQFSKDTVYLDTVFTNIGSSTYTLKVYNRSNKDISIPTIQLGKGTNSKYRMMIDGMQGNVGAEGKIFSNVELLAKDSLYIFIETTIDYSEFANPEAEYLYTDQIQFDAGTHFQKVELVTLVKDAVFLFPNRDSEGNYETIPIGVDENGETISGQGFFLDNTELNWNAEKPYVIYGFAGVPPAETLNIAPGSRVHFHSGSGLIAYNGSSIKINGAKSETEALENEVIFEGDRLEPNFADTPGQWSAVWLTQGSTGHEFTNLTIKNATVGILVSGNSGSATPDLKLKNVQIYNSGNAGILAQTGNIEGENVVINLAGSASLYCNYGGTYNFTQSTFNNNWSGTQKYSVRIDNFIEGATPSNFPLNATFTNSIIYGSNQNALLIAKEDTANAFNTVFSNCLVKLSSSNTIVNNALYAPVLSNPTNINENPSFVDANKNNLRISAASEAGGAGTAIGGEDILGQARNSPSDLGAYKISAE